MLELIEVGVDGKMTFGHGGPPSNAPVVRRDRAKEVRENLLSITEQVDSVLPADGRRPARRDKDSLR
jgi:hypothetical protein